MVCQFQKQELNTTMMTTHKKLNKMLDIAKSIYEEYLEDYDLELALYKFTIMGFDCDYEYANLSDCNRPDLVIEARKDLLQFGVLPSDAKRWKHVNFIDDKNFIYKSVAVIYND